MVRNNSRGFTRTPNLPMLRKKRNAQSASVNLVCGFTFIEILIGVSLISIVFFSIFGVFRMGINLVGKSKAKAGATALAVERMELIRNLSYDDVGTSGGIPAGNIPQTESVSLNGIEYTRRNLVQYVDSDRDGQGGADENGITTDYKRVKVEVSWPNSENPVSLITDIMPSGIESIVGGGTLIINVFDASALPVSSAGVHIENTLVNPQISVDIFTNSQGKVFFPGTPSSSGYEITVTKDGYSSSQTYSSDAINVNPNPGHLTILEGETTETSFIIDRVSTKTIRTWEPIAGFNWYDYFDDWTKVSSSSNADIISGSALLEEFAPSSYFASGFLISSDIGGIENLVNWGEFSWNDNVIASTTITYQVLYYEGVDLTLIPDVDLIGNESGFVNSPVDLSSLSMETYSTLRLKANLGTEDASSTPSLLDWEISWNAGPNPLPSIPFNMQGQKTIGENGGGDPVYKYSQNLSTGLGGQLEITGLEFDVYDIIIDGGSTGYNVSESCPFQPVNILPDTVNTTDFYLVPHQNNTLLVSVKDSLDNVLSGADIRLYKTGYDQSQETGACGQVFFSPLSASVDYEVEISKAGYETSTSSVEIAGQTFLELIMNVL